MGRQGRAGERTNAVVTAELADGLRTAREAKVAVEALPPSPAGAIVNRLYRSSIVLDEGWMTISSAAVSASPGPLGDQLVVASRRALELSNRVFDRGRVLIAAHLPTTTTAIELVPPAPVPDWVAEGLAPGPPLDVGLVQAPAPVGTSEAARRRALGVLIEAEAARVARAADLLTGPQHDALLATSRQMLVLATQLR